MVQWVTKLSIHHWGLHMLPRGHLDPPALIPGSVPSSAVSISGEWSVWRLSTYWGVVWILVMSVSWALKGVSLKPRLYISDQGPSSLWMSTSFILWYGHTECYQIRYTGPGLFFYFLLLGFWDRVSLCSPSCPETALWTRLALNSEIYLPTCLWLKMYTTTTRLQGQFFF